jgi:hypothetical protein
MHVRDALEESEKKSGHAHQEYDLDIPKNPSHRREKFGYSLVAFNLDKCAGGSDE